MSTSIHNCRKHATVVNLSITSRLHPQLIQEVTKTPKDHTFHEKGQKGPSNVLQKHIDNIQDFPNSQTWWCKSHGLGYCSVLGAG